MIALGVSPSRACSTSSRKIARRVSCARAASADTARGASIGIEGATAVDFIIPIIWKYRRKSRGSPQIFSRGPAARQPEAGWRDCFRAAYDEIGALAGAGLRTYEGSLNSVVMTTF